MPNPFSGSYQRPPAAALGRDAPKRTIVVTGTFADPVNGRPQWPGTGDEVARAFARALQAEGRYDVRTDHVLAQNVIAAAKGNGGDLDRLAAIRSQYPDVDFVVRGSVTDFGHTSELPEMVQRRGLFGDKNDAVVAIDLQIVDLKTGRIAVGEHIIGMASAKKESTAATYAGLTVNSYLFWSTPLGKASLDAIDKCVDRLGVVAPVGVAELRVARLAGWREVTLAGGKTHGIEVGQRYFVCSRGSDGALRVVNDPLMQQPLMIQVTAASKGESTGWVMGEPPAGVNLLATVLTRERP
ncbi:MAG: CsgG/HfaB family protein [Phycisphaerales bacterium]